jgi:histidinol-phosphate aminotransferase
MTITFADKLRRIPSYQAGVPKGKAPEAIADSEIAQLASNESPFGPNPTVVEAIARAAAAANRYPDPDATLMRRRIAERFEVDPADVAVSNGSCEVLLAAALALCEPGAELVYAWPSFSIYPYLAPLSSAREIRVPLTDGDEHDLDAIASEITAATQLAVVCNPNNPTSTHLPADRIGAFLEQVPGHVTVILDEAYIEFQTADDPDATADLRRQFSNLVILRTFSKVYGLAGLRVGYALCAPGFRAAIDAVRQPFSVSALAQAAGAEAIRHGDDVARRVEATIVERVTVEEGVRELGLRTPDSQANFSWVDLGDGDEGEVVAELADVGVVVRPGTPLGGPGHIRVTYGTPTENRRFLEALAGIDWTPVPRSGPARRR